MNSCFRLSLVLSVFLFLTVGSSSAQVNYTFGISGGTYIYQGDLAPGAIGVYRHLQPSLQLYAGKWINPYFQARLSFTTGKVAADDSDYLDPAWKRKRNFRFNATINELTAKMVFSPFGDGSVIPGKRLYPYVFAGVGASFVHIRRDWSRATPAFLSGDKMTSNLSLDSAHGIPSVLVAVPFGAGVSYTLSPHFSLFGEATYHLPVTDYLDGFSYTANNSRKDNYYSFQVGISYNLFRNSSMKCPTVDKKSRKLL